MYKSVQVKKKIPLKPRYLHPNPRVIKRNIIDKIAAYEKEKCSEAHGFVMEIENVDEYEKGVIDDENTGDVIFNVTYTLKTFKPERDDVIEIKVILINDIGIFGVSSECELLKVLIPIASVPDEYQYIKISTLPSGQKKESYLQSMINANSVINLDDVLRVRIVEYNFMDGKLFYLGSIRDSVGEFVVMSFRD